jgi:hypothetical protein
MSRPKPIVLLSISNKETYKQEEVLAAEGHMGGVLRWQTHQSKELQSGVQLPRTQVQEGEFLQSRTRGEPGKETEHTAQDRPVRCVSIKNRRQIPTIINSMDTKTAYTRTFMELLEQPIHDESIKTNYYTWWQNVRESYQARSH